MLSTRWKHTSIQLKLMSLLFAFAFACDVIEVANPADINDGQQQSPSTSADVVDRGSGSITNEPEQFAALLHNNGSKVWRAEQFTIEGLSMFLQCRLDDAITLSNDGTYQYDGGQDLCGAEDNVQDRSGNWEFNAANGTLIFDRGTSLETTGRVITLEENTIVLEGQYVSDLFGAFDVVGRYASN